MGANIETYGELFNSPSITPEIQRSLQKTRAYAEMRLKARTPVDTGALRASWKVEPAAQGISIVNPQHYAGFVELGTRKMRARPMVSPTLPEAQQFFTERLAEELARKMARDIKRNVGSSRGRAATQVAQAQRVDQRAVQRAASATSAKPLALSYDSLTAGVPKAKPGTPKSSKGQRKPQRRSS